MGMMQEFKEFAMRGNVVDLAVGVVIGGAFGKIVSSLVSDIIMPPLNLLTAKSGVNFNQLALKMPFRLPKLDEAKQPIVENGQPVMETVQYNILNYGPFIQSIIDFLIVAFAIFLAVRLMNSTKKRLEKEQAAAPPAEPSDEIKLLTQIRDALADR